jgi:hypothetical protein
LRTSCFSREGEMLCTQRSTVGAPGARRVRDKDRVLVC